MKNDKILSPYKLFFQPVYIYMYEQLNLNFFCNTGASTAEAQQRVAVEIAEQFLAISGVSDKYSVTGIVNAPVLAAAMTGDNGIWIDLAKKLGKLGARFLQKNLNAPIESQTVGDGNKNKKFIHTAVLVGILSGQTKNGLNLVNAPTLAKDAGININDSHVNGDVEAIVVRVGQHSIKGILSKITY